MSRPYVPQLIAPREKPDGTVSWEEQAPELGALIRDGDGRSGWLGDPNLSLHCNTTYADDDPAKKGWPRWEIWRRHDDGSSSLMVWCVLPRLPDGLRLTTMLARADSRTHDIAEELLAARDKRDAAARKATTEQAEGLADKLAFALGRDLSLPAQSGRPFRTGR
jgi:hypothetical protein